MISAISFFAASAPAASTATRSSSGVTTSALNWTMRLRLMAAALRSFCCRSFTACPAKDLSFLRAASANTALATSRSILSSLTVSSTLAISNSASGRGPAPKAASSASSSTWPDVVRMISLAASWGMHRMRRTRCSSSESAVVRRRLATSCPSFCW
ncbi:MAG: hypothetical protein J3K34DRAFT_448720 [Monoraphidium minutum]|nr:MAG: hypothetical protein J3K34DRAFT_448720 [Monoraphidium minutum]